MPDWMPPMSCTSTRSREHFLQRLDAFGATFCVGFGGSPSRARRAGSWPRNCPCHDIAYTFPADFHLGLAQPFVATDKNSPQVAACDNVSAFTVSPDFVIPPSAKVAHFFFAAAREQT